MDGLEYCCSLLVLPPCLPSSFSHPSFYVCIWMYVFMYGGHACECWYMNMDIHVEARSQSHVSGAIYLVAIILQFLSWPGTHKLGKASWPGTLEDLHFSASPAQELRGCLASYVAFGSWAQALMLLWQVLCWLPHLPSPSPEPLTLVSHIFAADGKAGVSEQSSTDAQGHLERTWRWSVGACGCLRSGWAHEPHREDSDSLPQGVDAKLSHL